MNKTIVAIIVAAISGFIASFFAGWKLKSVSNRSRVLAGKATLREVVFGKAKAESAPVQPVVPIVRSDVSVG